MKPSAFSILHSSCTFIAKNNQEKWEKKKAYAWIITKTWLFESEILTKNFVL